MNKIVPLFLQSHPKARAWNNSCKNVASNVECECELILQQKKLAVKFFIQISDTIFCILLDFCLIRLKLIIVFVCFLHQQVSFTTTFYYYVEYIQIRVCIYLNCYVDWDWDYIYVPQCFWVQKSVQPDQHARIARTFFLPNLYNTDPPLI